MMKWLAILLICFASSVLGGPKPPSWLKTSYKVDGTLQLPYAEIIEPFTSYYDPVNGRSRIDYYAGMVITIQQAGKLDTTDYGTSYKVAPITTEKVANQTTCFQINGTADNLIDVQGVLPDLTNFTLVTTDNDKAQVWQLVTMEGDKKNTYTMWVLPDDDDDDSAVPIRYEMMGYDSLLGSHFDKYVVVYDKFKKKPKFEDDTFQPDKALVCGDFPTPPGRTHDHLLVDPISELVHNNDEHFTPSFDKFKHHHGKDYKHAHEHRQREHNFRHNLRFIHSHNRAGHGYTVAVNHLADKTPSELTALRGYRPSSQPNSGLPFDKSQHTSAIPDQLDWRLYGAVTQVKDQAVCGSCWSFGSAGAVEGAYFLATKKLVRLSQQALIDCSWGEGNNGCDGGEDFRSYDWIMKNGGLPSEEDYGHYLGQDGFCHVNKVSVTAKVESYVNVTSGDVEALRQALAAHGPAQVSIDASHRTFSFYSNGVYYDPACKNGPMDLDHSVLAVGYGTLEVNGEQQPYWLVKNSWSTYWGNDGYVLMSRKDNNCGVATAASYVNIKN